MIKTYCDRCGNLIDTSFSDCNVINVDGKIKIRKYTAPMSSTAHTTRYITSSKRVNKHYDLCTGCFTVSVNKHYDLCTGCFTVFVNNFMSNVKGEEG